MAADVTISESPYFQHTIPATDSGRVSQIAAEPGVPGMLYVASSEGGLWRTVDGGHSWCSLTEIDTFPSLSLGAVALDPSVIPTAIYLGLGDVQQQSFGGTGRGVVKSVDGGKTWSPKPAPLGDSRAVTSLLVHPKMPSIVLAGTDKGLFRSEDAGKSFSLVRLPEDLSPDVTTVRDLSWIEGSQIILTIGRNFLQEESGGGADVLVSTDDGKTWQHARGLGDGNASRISLAVAKKNSQTVYALAADQWGFFLDIFKSADGGKSWEGTNAFQIHYKTVGFTKETPDSLFNPRDEAPRAPQGIYDQIAVVDPENPQIAYFGGVTNLIKTEDGGLSYSVVSDWLLREGLPYIHPDFQAAAFDAGGHLWIGGDGGLARSSDGGKTWSTEENKNLTTHLVYAISEGPGDLIAAGLQDNGTRVRNGSGSAFPQRLMADGFDVLIHPDNPDVLLGSIYNTWIFRSENGGAKMQASWQDIEDGDHQDAPFYTRLVPSPADASSDTVFTFVRRKVYKSIDFGLNWTALPGQGLGGETEILNLAVSARDSQIMGLLVEEDGVQRVLLSLDGGTSWTPAGELPKNGKQSPSFLSSINFSPVDSNILYVASRAPDKDVHHLWRSADGGRSWKTVDGSSFPTGAPVNVVVGDPVDARIVYAGTHFGVYRSQDGGRLWDRFGSRLPFVSVTDIHVQMSGGSRRVRIATFGRGIWELRSSVISAPSARCPSEPR
jgi:photosystem II stability/assembly factor-like uncharacterized protein